MNEKSHVSLELRVCMVCGCEYETGTLLIDQRLRETLDPLTTTGWGLCPGHQRLHDDGFILLIECNPERSAEPSSDGTLKFDDAYRTGRVARLTREAFCRIFDVPVSEDVPCVFVTPEVIEKLQRDLTRH
jgi:hypothetical protein